MTTHSTPLFLLFFFNAPATTEIYTLSLHDALPILHLAHERRRGRERWLARVGARGGCHSVSPSWDDEQHRDQRNHQRGHRSHLAHPSILVGVRVPSNLVCVTHQQYPCRSERREADPPASLRIPRRADSSISSGVSFTRALVRRGPTMNRRSGDFPTTT